MKRVVMLAIGGMDADLLRVYGPSLPNLRRLMLESPFLEMKSTFPPETMAAWVSLYTGLSPAHHGILDQLHQPDEPADHYTLPGGETFWEIAGQAGKRVCIVNPKMAYPARSINGVMLSLPPPGLKGYGASVTPDEEWQGYMPRTIPHTLQLPQEHQLEDYCRSLYSFTSQQAALALELFHSEPWDIFFLQLDALDYVQHTLWRYNDPGDPGYPGRNKHAGRILDFYYLFDQIIGHFRSTMDQDCVLFVVSEHGHGRSCMHQLNLNEWLRGLGVLTSRIKKWRHMDYRYLRERTRQQTKALLTRLQMHKMAVHQHTTNLINEQKTMAQVVDIAGMSPFGGIKLNQETIDLQDYDYERMRTWLIHQLEDLRVNGNLVVNWVKKREEVLSGELLNLYPDILFELRSDYGVGKDLFVPLTTANPFHRLLSGDHRMDGVLLVGNMSEEVEVFDSMADPVVMDIAPTILHLLDVVSTSRDGQVLIQPYKVRQLI